MEELRRLVANFRPDLSKFLSGNVRLLYRFYKKGEAHNLNGRPLKDAARILESKLHDLSLIYPVKPNNRTQEYFDEGWRKLAVVESYTRQERRQDAAKLSEMWLRKSIRYGFCKLAAHFASNLHYYYYSIESDKTKGRQYRKIADKYRRLMCIELELDTYLAELAYLNQSTRSYTTKYKRELNRIVQSIKPHTDIVDSPYSIIVIKNILITQAYSNYDYKSVLQHCSDAIDYLEERGIARTSGFYYKMVPALMIRGELDKAADTIRKALKGVKKGIFSWAVFTAYRVILSLHAKDYSAAYLLYLEIEKNYKIQGLLGEMWLIIKGHIWFLILQGKIEDKHKNKFLIGRYFNNFNFAEQDKEGYNVNLILLQIILRLAKGENGWLIDKAESIQKYIDRNLRGQDSHRSKTLLSMLLKLPQQKFHPVAIRRHTRSMHKSLSSNPIKLNMNLDMEVIPYTDIWEMVMDILQRSNKLLVSKKKTTRKT